VADSHNREGENPAEYWGSIKRHPIVLFIILILIIVFILLGVFLNYKSRRISGLEERINALEREVQKRDQEIHRLETLLAPFRTIALGRYTGIESEALSKLASRFWKIELAPETLRDYKDIASLNFMGRPFEDSEAVVVATPISEMLEEAATYDKNNDTYFWLCGSEPEAKYRAVIEKYPKFPFSYYCLSTCLYKRGDSRWKYYARKSLEILEQTTSVSGHRGIHDVIKSKLLLLLNK